MSMDGQAIPNTQLQLAQVGDALLKLIYITNFFPNTTSEQQRQFSVLTSNVHLAKVACILGLQELSPHLTESSNIRSRATVVEAIIGAVFLDSGMDIPAAGHAIETMRVFEHVPDERSKERQHAIVLPSPKWRRARSVARKLDSAVRRCTSSNAGGEIDEARVGPGKRSFLSSEASSIAEVAGNEGQPLIRKKGLASCEDEKLIILINNQRGLLEQAEHDPKGVLEAMQRFRTNPSMLRHYMSFSVRRKEKEEREGRAGSLMHQYYTLRSFLSQRLLDFRLAAGPEWRSMPRPEHGAEGARSSRATTDCVELHGQALLAEQAARPSEPHQETSRQAPLHTLDDTRKFYATAVSDPKAALKSIPKSSRGNTKGWGTLLRSALIRNRRQQQILDEAGEVGSEAYQGHMLRALAFEKLLEYWSAIRQQSRSEQQGDRNGETQSDVNATVPDQVEETRASWRKHVSGAS
ncbi:Putative ribonuclease III domain-containing protein [Septoria linicola]|uniref:Ribonuclease III domain-containing protein n=1 Tax=Septoria linicola TaxID=215465 RepID=A0A9Q9EP84_9PEZI|nr:Putative ribonuclease III domain-containing protein [Septoria linicola]